MIAVEELEETSDRNLKKLNKSEFHDPNYILN